MSSRRPLDERAYLTCSYWDAMHDVAIADCHAEWVNDVTTKEHVWQLYADAAEPLGYDSAPSGRTDPRPQRPAFCA